MSGDEEREKGKKKYNSFIRPSLSKYADEWKQTYGTEKDLVNLLHQLYDVEGYQSTACPTVPDIKSNTELLKIQPGALYEAPENVKLKDKDSEVECVTDACCVVTGRGFKNCQESVFEVSTSKQDNGRHDYLTREEKLEALWSSRIKENGNVIRSRVHSSPGLPLVCQLMNALRQTLLLCGVSEKTCGRPLLHVSNESDLAVIIMEGIKELSCNEDQSAIDRFQHILKESLALYNEMMMIEGEDESSDGTVQFLKVLLDMITCVGSHRNNKVDELNFDSGKIHNNLRNRQPTLLDDNVIHKRYNIEILDKLINFEDEEKKGSEGPTALQLKVKEERVSVGILSAIVIKEDALLLKEMKMFSSQLYKTKAATTTGGEVHVYEREGQGKKMKKMKLSRVTREIRARMKRRTELEREEWTKEESSDEN